MNDIHAEFEKLSGLEFLRKMIREWHSSPMSAELNMRLIDVADGTATFEAFPSARYYNPQLRLHGGYCAALIDSATGCAVQTKLAPNTGYGTIDLKVSYVRKITEASGRLICTGHVIHSGRNLFTADARVIDAHDKLCAHGSATFMVYPK